MTEFKIYAIVHEVPIATANRRPYISSESQFVLKNHIFRETCRGSRDIFQIIESVVERRYTNADKYLWHSLELVDRFKSTIRELILGCDANSHNIWKC